MLASYPIRTACKSERKISENMKLNYRSNAQ